MPGESPWTKEPGGLQSIGSHSQTRLKELSTVIPPSLSHISGQSPGTTIPVQLRKALESALTVTPLPLPLSPSPSLPLSCLRISDWPQRSLDGAQLLSLLPGVLMKGSGQSPYQAQSSVHFTVSRGQLTPHPTRPSSTAQKRRRLPPYILGLGFGERGCSKPSKPGIRTPGAPAPANGAQLSVSPLVQAPFSCLQDEVLAYLFISQSLSSFSSHSPIQHIY